VLHLIPDRQLFLFLLLAFLPRFSLVFVVTRDADLVFPPRRAAAQHPGGPTTTTAAKSS